MKTLENIQHDLGIEQKRMAKIVLLLRAGAFVGGLFDDATEKERLETIGYFGLVLCQLCCNDGITVPYGPHAPNKKQMSTSLDPASGVVVWMGRLFQCQSEMTVNMAMPQDELPEDMLAAREHYQQEVKECLAHVLYYLDCFARSISKQDNLLVLANMAHEGAFK